MAQLVLICEAIASLTNSLNKKVWLINICEVCEATAPSINICKKIASFTKWWEQIYKENTAPLIP